MDNIKKKIKNILVTTDFSEISNFAILRAAIIAQKTKAKLTILHVIQKNTYDMWLDTNLKNILPKELWLNTKEQRTEMLQEKISTLSNYKINIQYKIINEGKPAVKILQYAKKNKIDLLIIGAHGKYSMRDAFLGTTAGYIAERSHCPILIVKKSAKTIYKTILVPVDFSDLSKRAMKYALQFFSNAKTHLLHVGDYEYEELLKREENKNKIPHKKIIEIRKAILFYLKNKMKRFTSGYSKKLDKDPYTIVFGYPPLSIVNEAKKTKYDLVVMGMQGHGWSRHLFIGSVANHVITEINKDILLVPPSY